MVAYSPNVLVVNPSVPAKTVKELIALIKANPGKYSFARSRHRLDAASVRRIVQADLRPRHGARAVSRRRAGDHLDHRRPHADRVYRAAAGARQCEGRQVARARRSRGQTLATLPDVPTMAEAGFPGQEADTLTGVMAPAGTPKAIVDLLYREIAKAVAQPDVAAHLRSSVSCRWRTSRRNSARASRARSKSGARWCTTRICASSDASLRRLLRRRPHQFQPVGRGRRDRRAHHEPRLVRRPRPAAMHGGAVVPHHHVAGLRHVCT